jgi:hypothetical protein
VHSNGLSGTYLDCGQLGEHTLAQARLAATSWAPTGATVEFVPQCGAACLCRQTATQAAVWCYAGSLVKGRVFLTNLATCASAICPSGASGFPWD